jgi:hypothetical protein
MRLTAKSIAGVKLPHDKRDHIEWDDDIPRFGARWRRGQDGKWGKPRAIYEYGTGAR